MDIFTPTKQRPRLLEFRDALDARRSSLRRDDCRDWAIFGNRGHIYAVPEGFQLVIGTGERSRLWSAVKAKLSF